MSRLLVLQEAWKFGRTVICPDLGGMAEKAHKYGREKLFQNLGRRACSLEVSGCQLSYFTARVRQRFCGPAS